MQERPYATAYWPFSVRESCTSNANPPSSIKMPSKPMFETAFRYRSNQATWV
ncbi:hypothetical protein [Neisseria meningitidis serogroup B]|uniref:Uncharacterized protein n=1 Tax=Neisseria meningitidis serogroup B TaxID=491 RepID=A0A0H5QXU3_NEIMI|nr:hypothetical protein [Neisseria meningitidis serogroup B]